MSIGGYNESEDTMVAMLVREGSSDEHFHKIIPESLYPVFLKRIGFAPLVGK
jgi:hypothetical protein